jgi:chemotaxis protein methyltransferase CheR
MPLSQSTFDELRRLIHGLCGLSLSSDKMYLVHHRLEPVVEALGLPSYEELCARLRRSGWHTEHEQVVEAITTHETSFFRDGHPFEALGQLLLPEVIEAARQRKLALGPRPYGRIWCAGASTGQEAYSVGMLLEDRLRQERADGVAPGDVILLATDVCRHILAVARAGVYPEPEVLRSVRAPLRDRAFEKVGAGWRVRESLRRFMEFRRLNLLDGARELGLFDLILCRNVLIYFDDDTRRRVSATFFEHLRPGGVLLLGAAENLYGIHDTFRSYQNGPTIFYRKPQPGS